jgi:hypothetical protein
MYENEKIHFPTYRYKLENGEIKKRVFQNVEELEAAGTGWADSPARVNDFLAPFDPQASTSGNKEDNPPKEDPHGISGEGNKQNNLTVVSKTKEELEVMPMAELKNLCSSVGVIVKNTLKKTELIALYLEKTK